MSRSGRLWSLWSLRSVLHMAARSSELRVRLDDDLRARLDRFAYATRRNLTESVNLLLSAALAVVESAEDVDALFRPIERG